MNNKKASELVDKYLAGQCTAEEQTALFAYFNTLLDKNSKSLSPEKAEQLNSATWEAINNQINSAKNTTVVKPFWRSWTSITAAAALLIVGSFLVKQGLTTKAPNSATTTQDILPTGPKALLTLDNGHTIELNTSKNGIDFSKESITYHDGSTLSTEGNMSSPTYRLSTPKGATYQVTLPDGTTVLLNGGSKISYPSRFDSKKRKVQFEGEGYFTVKKQTGIPFLLVTKGQEIKVLGTEFNVSTYDQTAIKTTLVEGSVQVSTDTKNSSTFLLLPGEQSIVDSHGLFTKKKVNLKVELAWQSGLFYFDKTPFSEILQQVSQWYDVDIEYLSGVPKGTFSGIIDRNVSLKTLLEYFDESSYNEFKLENKTLKVKAQK